MRWAFERLKPPRWLALQVRMAVSRLRLKKWKNEMGWWEPPSS